MSIFVDFHVLQTVPPSCVNRDDTGSPKTAIYGGVTRARVSSQAWKHAIREEFKSLFTEDKLANRTKHIVEMIEQEMLTMKKSENPDISDEDIFANNYSEIHARTLKVLKEAGINVKSPEKNKPEVADALFFISNKQIKAVADVALDDILNDKSKDKERKDAVIKALKENQSVDIALFGRMLASNPELNSDATAQVAHAISTHAVQNEYDYFTAVDDCQSEDNTGAGHLGTVEFNSSTLYRYANVNITELSDIISKESVPETVSKFAKAFICSMPTGKENTFANRTLPDAVYITIRSDQPVNLCGAFEKPVPKGYNGYVENSGKQFVEYAEKIYKDYGSPEAAYCIGDEMSSVSEKLSMPELLSALEKSVNEYLDEV